MLAQKIIAPKKWFMIRGNHEIRSVNGGGAEKCFRAQCVSRFGEDLGDKVWRSVNDAFDCLPYAAIVQNQIFCVHGGIPHPLTTADGVADDNRLEQIEKLPRRFDPDAPAITPEAIRMTQLALEIMWADPATESQELRVDPYGFLRGAMTQEYSMSQNDYFAEPRLLAYGKTAVDRFCERYGFSRILRGHQACGSGVELSKNGKVFTVFSDSKNHGLGPAARCGCVLVDDVIHVIVGKPVGDGGGSVLGAGGNYWA